MNIDAQIQEILLRSSPVNDNDANHVTTYLPENKNPIYGINVIGNHNVVVSSGLLSLTVSCLVLFITLAAFY